MNSLFPQKNDFHIARITEADARGNSDHFRLFTELVSSNEDMYPGISDWLKNKVTPGLRSSSRVGFIGYEGERPIITAVVKKGAHTKFCHLRIAENFQDIHLGEVFFSLMALEARGQAKEVHFTLPESLWLRREKFFNAFGFCSSTPATQQYRVFEEELRCSAPFTSVWEAVLEKLPNLMGKFSINNYTMHPRLLVSIRPDYADKILEGRKTVEIRRRFASKWNGQRVALYSSRPVQALVGEATIREVKSASPKAVWEEYGSRIGCTEDEFLKYTAPCREVYAILLDGITPYIDRIPLTQVEALIQEDLVPPQSHCELELDKPWTKAISIAALLHGSMRTVKGSISSL